jgi:hypothetical protein
VYWEKHPTISNAIIVYATASTAGTTSIGGYTFLGTLSFGTSVTMEYYSGSGAANTITGSSAAHSPNGLLFYSSSIENYYTRKLVRKDASGNLVDGAIVRFPQNTVWPVPLTFSVSCCRVGTMNEGQGTESNGGTLINLSTPNSSPASSSPAVIQVPSSFIGSQTPFTYQIVASDPDNDGLRFNRGTTTQFGGSWLTSGTFPTGLTISNAGLLTWQIPSTVNGYNVSAGGSTVNNLANLAFTIEDYDPLDPNAATKSRASYDVILRIANTTTNQPPQLVSLPQTTQFTPYVLGTGSTYNFSIVVQDVYNASTNTLPGQGAYVTVTEVSQIPNFSYTTSIVNDQTVVNATFTPSASQEGNSYTAIFQFDDGSLITFANVSIQVANNPKPTITDFQEISNICSGVQFATSDFTSNYTDPDNNALEWIRLTNIPNTGALLFKGSQVANGDEILLSEVGQLTYFNSQPGIYTITWEGKDDQGNWSQASKTITVVNEGLVTSGVSNTNTSTTTPVVVEPALLVVFDGLETTASVEIISGLAVGDILQVSIPQGITASSSFNNGVLTITGSFTATQLQSILRLVEFQSATNNVTRSFEFRVGSPVVSGCDHLKALRTLNNTVPTITGATNQSTCLSGTTPSMSITVGDAETPDLSLLVLSVVASSNPSVVPVANVLLGGTGSSRTVTVTNTGVYGSSIITLGVTDAGGGFATQSFIWSNTVSDGIDNTSGVTFNPYSGTPIVIDPYLSVTTSNTLNGAVVSVDNFQSGDVLGVASGYSLPSGISTSYNASTGVLAISGSASAATMQAVLRKIVFSTASLVETARTISFSLGNAVPNASNGHYYEYVATSNVGWAQAKQAASQLTFNGLGGYLATVTSSAENQFILTKLTNDGWLGASDDFNEINLALGSSVYADQSASEGNWHWVTGPLADRIQFWNGGVNGSAPAGKYANWNYPNQPDNHLGAEHYLQIYFQQQGKWNDLPASFNLQGFIVEYGGLSSDNATCFTISDTKIVELNQTPTINAPNSMSICVGNALSASETFTIGDANDGTSNLNVACKIRPNCTIDSARNCTTRLEFTSQVLMF